MSALFITTKDRESIVFGRCRIHNQLMCVFIEIGIPEKSNINELDINKEQAIQIISHLQKEFSI